MKLVWLFALNCVSHLLGPLEGISSPISCQNLAFLEAMTVEVYKVFKAELPEPLSRQELSSSKYTLQCTDVCKAISHLQI